MLAVPNLHISIHTTRSSTPVHRLQRISTLTIQSMIKVLLKHQHTNTLIIRNTTQTLAQRQMHINTHTILSMILAIKNKDNNMKTSSIITTHTVMISIIKGTISNLNKILNRTITTTMPPKKNMLHHK